MTYFAKRFHNEKFLPCPKPEKAIKKKKGLVKKYKPTGEYAMFQEIWLERKHICSRCQDVLPESISGYDGLPVVNPMFFDHIITKKQKSELRLDKSNIRLLCFDCHFIRHNGTKEQFENLKTISK